MKYIHVTEESDIDNIPMIKKISLQALREFLDKKTTDVSVEKEFIYGRSISIEQIAIDGKIYPFRKFDEKKSSSIL